MVAPFTSEQAFEADDAGEAIMLTDREARHFIERQHCSQWADFAGDCPHLAASPLINAADVLRWLGY